MSSADLVFEEVAVGTNWLGPSREVGVAASQSVVFDADSDLAPQLLLRAGLFNGGGDLVGERPGPRPDGRGLPRASPWATPTAPGSGEAPALGIGGALLRNGSSSTREIMIAADFSAGTA
ncbi:MAG: hypothetical protein R3F59_34350 [Myxococcota bacterium]